MIPALLGVAAVGCVAYGVLVEAHDFQVRRFTLPLLPTGAEPVRLLHISDLHLLPSQTRKRQFVRALTGLEPDLVVSTGDNISAADSLPPLAEALSGLLKVPGVFVFGSNDYKAPSMRNPLRYLVKNTRKAGPVRTDLPTEELRSLFTDSGWQDLNDRRADLTVNGTRFAFRGTDDGHEHRDDYSAVAGPQVEDAVNVGVTHAPYLYLLDAMTADGMDLILAGHTHGGQVCVPGYGALITNCDLPRDRAKGLFTHESADRTAQVHVSAGVGMSPFAPYRFACPPEVSLLELVAAAE